MTPDIRSALPILLLRRDKRTARGQPGLNAADNG